MRLARPGIQRIEDEAPPMVRRDVVFTHSVDVKDRGGRTNPKDQNSVSTEGLKRYNGAQRGAKACETAATDVENEDIQRCVLFVYIVFSVKFMSVSVGV